MSLEEYKKRSLDEQILSEPDTFVGGTDEIEDRDYSLRKKVCINFFYSTKKTICSF